MEYQQKYRWAAAGLIVMVLLNAITLGALWFNSPEQSNQEERDRPPRDGLQQFMKQEFNLTDTQTDTIRTIRGRHFQEIPQKMGDLAQTREEYFEAMTGTSQPSAAVQDSLSKALCNNYLQVERMLYRHISEVGSVLNYDQRSRYKQLMKDTFIRRGHNGKREQRRMHREQ